MKHEEKLLGYYNYTVVLTYIGMLTGFMGIAYAFEGRVTAAIVCLMVAGFCDMFDGAIASTKKDRTACEKNFGIQIDSLSDLICFGVLPGITVYSMSGKNALTLTVSAMFVLCGLIRLAYFNVDEQERQKTQAGPRSVYYGLPITMSAIFVPLVYGFAKLIKLNAFIPLTVALLIMGVMYILPFRLKKPHLFGKICMVLAGVAELVLMIFACMDV
ncbi:MAG: CDP-alcohol phosphatidyltransferase family protein [Clostridia bacterium]|nr:CDP-alcohol phosphatidyltransferase family protein [Clostridia bacterium]